MCGRVDEDNVVETVSPSGRPCKKYCSLDAEEPSLVEDFTRVSREAFSVGVGMGRWRAVPPFDSPMSCTRMPQGFTFPKAHPRFASVRFPTYLH